MGLNKSQGGMYQFVTHTWNPIRGECPHDCIYCYMKEFKGEIGELRLEEKEFKTYLGMGKYIFVGSSTDMFSAPVQHEWILSVLAYCKKFDNKYLFQSKNPQRFMEFINDFPTKTVLGTTIETNRTYFSPDSPRNTFSNAPEPKERFRAMMALPENTYEKMVSVEPIFDFDLDEMVWMLSRIKPTFISIGAESKGHNLPEPSKKKIEQLIEEMKKSTEVRLKPNLARLMR